METIHVGQIEIRFLLEGSLTGGQLAVFEFKVPARARVPVPHSHVAYDETIYGLEGVVAWTVEDRKLDLGPGGALFIRRGAVHHFENTGATDARQLAVITPGILGPEFFREIAEIINAGGPPNLERMKAVMLKHGLRPAPPPPATTGQQV